MVSAVKLSIWEPSTAKPFKNSAHKIRIFWEIIGETIEINGEQMPRLVSKEFTLSLNEKEQAPPGAAVVARQSVHRGRTAGFDLRKVLGIGCQLQIIHKEGNNGTTYANVETILALPRKERPGASGNHMV